MVFQIYITDIGKALLESLVKAYGGDIKVERFADLIAPRKVETRTAKEVISSIASRLNDIAGDNI